MAGGEVQARRHPWLKALRFKDGRVVRYPAIMGVLNVTPDSFSDGGRYLDPRQAVAKGLELAAEGADLIDVGGESTRPGAAEVPVEVECARIVDVIRQLSGQIQCPISVDTRKAEVARQALAAGAAMVNDVSALSFDPQLARVVAVSGAPVVLMHMRGTPQTMTKQARYHAVVTDVCRELAERVRLALGAGIRPSRIILDPGIGFAKRAAHNLALLANLPRLHRLGYPILVGVSRKSLIRQIGGAEPQALLFGTAAAVALSISQGAAIVRVHEPAPMRAVVRIAGAIRDARSLH